MKNYDKTLWLNNKTVVDADKLNNIEDQMQVLTLTTVENNDRLQTVEDTLPMKANTNHTHSEYSLTTHTHDDLATNAELTEVKSVIADLQSNDIIIERDIDTLRTELVNLKEEISIEFKKYFDDATIVDDMLNLYSNGKLIKSLKLPKGQAPAMTAICGEFLSGEALCGGETQGRAYSPTTWQDGVTPVNAANLNKIENKLVNLVDKIQQLEDVGVDVTGALIHVGTDAPDSTSGLWIDNSEEDYEEILPPSILDDIAEALRDHKGKIAELFFLTDAYLDDGEFTDEEEDVQILDGGIF